MRIGKTTDGKVFKLPDDAVTQTWAILGRKGQGKTYAAGKLVETFLEQKVQTIILDPVGNWWGLRYDRTGKKPSGFDIPILGGLRGDIQLRPEAGEVIAAVLASAKQSAILDVSQFRKNERKRFVTDFAEEIYRQQKRDPSLMHFVLEEAQVFAPQQIKDGKDALRMLGAIEDIVRLGRNCGIGCTMVSQRPQSINNEILNQAEPLVLFQLVASHERKAVEEWMRHAGGDSKSALAELTGLNKSECFFWSPAWIKTLVKMRFDEKKTYDASSTIRPGESRKVASMKPLDMKALSATMQQYVDEQKANDPTELKRRIRELEKQAGKTNSKATTQTVVDTALVERAVASERRRCEQYFIKRETQWKRCVTTLQGRISKASAALEVNHLPVPDVEALPDTPVSPTPSRRVTTSTSAPASSVKMARGGAARILASLAQHHPRTLTISQIGMYAGLSTRGGTFSTYMSKLRTTGQIQDQSDGRVAITDAGIANAGDIPPLPTGESLRDFWRQKCGGGGQRRIFDVLLENYPATLTKDQIGELTELSTAGGTFSTYLSKLRTMELIEDVGRDEIKAADDLFDQ